MANNPLPYTKTEVQDNTQRGASTTVVSELNVGSIINATTGSMERVTLNSVDELIRNFCTGTKITQTDDITIQRVAALLNTTPVDVVRVGTANIKVGKTDTGKTIYTDGDYNLIDILSRLKFVKEAEQQESVSVIINGVCYYLGKQPDVSASSYVKVVGNEITIANLIAGVVPFVINTNDGKSVITETDVVSGSDTVSTETSFIDVNQKLYIVDDDEKAEKEISAGAYISINGTPYYFVGANSYSQSGYEDNAVLIHNYNENNARTTVGNFIARVLQLAIEESYAIAQNLQIVFDDYHIIDFGGDIKQRMHDNVIYYNPNDVYKSGYMVFDPDDEEEKPTVYWYGENAEDVGNIVPVKYFEQDQEENKYNIVMLSNRYIKDGQLGTAIRNKSLIDLLILLDDAIYSTEAYAVKLIGSDIRSVWVVDNLAAYFNDMELRLSDNLLDSVEIENLDDGIYETTLKLNDEVPTNYNAKIDGTVYYNGEQPKNYDDVVDYTQLSKDKLTFTDYVAALISQLETDFIIGRINMSTILMKNDIEVESKTFEIKKSLIKQDITIKGAKFAIVAKFPSAKALFSANWSLNETITDYKVINLNYSYNTVSGTIKLSFDSNAIDGYGTYLYYDKFNNGQYKNPYIHILCFDIDEDSTPTPESGIIQAFGNEILISENGAPQYASAIQKFANFKDKQYSFIWDGGYANPIVAKAALTVNQAKNAQYVPSYPSEYKTLKDIQAYNESLGLDSANLVKVVPGHKGMYCGNFLTEVPGAVSYMVARINSFNNRTQEFQALFGSTRGIVSAPNLVWQDINDDDLQALANMNINTIVTDMNGTYLNFNLTGQSIQSYLSEEQNVYMANTIAHVCETLNPTYIAEVNDYPLWDRVEKEVYKALKNRVLSGKNPTYRAIRVRCIDVMQEDESLVEDRILKYYVDVILPRTVAYVNAYVSVVPMNSFTE